MRYIFGGDYYIAISPPPICQGNGGKWLYITGLMLVTNYFIPIFKIVYCFCSRTFV